MSGTIVQTRKGISPTPMEMTMSWRLARISWIYRASSYRTTRDKKTTKIRKDYNKTTNHKETKTTKKTSKTTTVKTPPNRQSSANWTNTSKHSSWAIPT